MTSKSVLSLSLSVLVLCVGVFGAAAGTAAAQRAQDPFAEGVLKVELAPSQPTIFYYISTEEWARLAPTEEQRRTALPRTSHHGPFGPGPVRVLLRETYMFVPVCHGSFDWTKTVTRDARAGGPVKLSC